MKEIEEFFAFKKNNLSSSTLRSYTYVLNKFINYFNIIHIEDLKNVTTKDIQLYMDFLIENKKNVEKAKNSANAHFRIIKAFFNWIVSMKYLAESPMINARRFKEAKILKVYLNKEEKDKIILSGSSLKNKAILALALYTGIRVDEIVKIKKSDIAEGHLVINGKGRKQRKVVLNPYVIDIISEYLKSRNDDCPFLFVSKKGFGDSAGIVHGLTTQAIRDIVNKQKKLAKIDPQKAMKTTPHTLRRTFAIAIVKDQRASAFQVQKVLGHESILTTQRYLEASGAEIADDVMLEQEAPKLS